MSHERRLHSHAELLAALTDGGVPFILLATGPRVLLDGAAPGVATLAMPARGEGVGRAFPLLAKLGYTPTASNSLVDADSTAIEMRSPRLPLEDVCIVALEPAVFARLAARGRRATLAGCAITVAAAAEPEPRSASGVRRALD